MHVTTHALDIAAIRAHAWTEFTLRCVRVHAPPIAGARARASRVLFSSAAVVVRVGAAAVEDVHVEENHVAELVHDKVVEPVRAAVHAGEPVCAVRVCERDPQREKVSVGKKSCAPST